MTTTTDALRAIEEIDALLKKATPRPWRTAPTSIRGEVLLQTDVVKDFASRSVQMREPDAALIVALVNNADALLTLARDLARDLDIETRAHRAAVKAVEKIRARLASVTAERDEAVALLREANIILADGDYGEDRQLREVRERIDALLARTAHGEARVCPTCGLDDPVLHPCDATGTAYPCFDDFHRYVAARRCAEPGCEIRGLTRKREWRCVPHLQPATPPAGTDEGSK